MKLTKRNIDTRCLPPTPGELNGEGKPLRQLVYMDDSLKGFGLIVGRGSKTFFAQGSIRGKSVRITIGRLGAPVHSRCSRHHHGQFSIPAQIRPELRGR